MAAAIIAQQMRDIAKKDARIAELEKEVHDLREAKPTAWTERNFLELMKARGDRNVMRGVLEKIAKDKINTSADTNARIMLRHRELALQALTSTVVVTPEDPRADVATHLHAGDEIDVARWGRIRQELAKVEDLKAQLVERDGQLLALREVLQMVSNDPHRSINGVNRFWELHSEALASTDQPAREAVERIRREALEETLAAIKAAGLWSLDRSLLNLPQCRKQFQYIIEVVRNLAGGE